jgi:gluconate 2-dehydrogenase gamma chain
MSDISRRDALRRIGLVLTATGMVDRVAAQEVHQMVGEARASGGGAYTPKALSAHGYQTLERLTDLIIPVEPASAEATAARRSLGEGGNGAPGAVAAGAAAWIDMMASENGQLKGIYTTGLAWLDTAMVAKGATDFVTAPPARQTELLDLIAYRRNRSPELAPGIEFFTWARRMTVDAFYTSAIGIKDIDYRGNTPLASYPAPTEAIAYALKKSGL